MEIILDELTPMEFFTHGGIVKVTVNDDDLMEECGLKRKYTFFEYKKYVRFFRDIYMKHMQNSPEANTYELYKEVNRGVDVNPSIGQFQYVVDLEYDHVRSYEMAKFYYSSDKRDKDIDYRDPYGIRNVCFSLIEKGDEKWGEYARQRLEMGFDASETWNFDATIAKFIYPRLKVFIDDVKKIGSYPYDMTFGEWIGILEEMLKGFEILASDDIKTPDEEKIVKRALELLSEHFLSLWT